MKLFFCVFVYLFTNINGKKNSDIFSAPLIIASIVSIKPPIPEFTPLVQGTSKDTLGSKPLPLVETKCIEGKTQKLLDHIHLLQTDNPFL